MPPRGNGNFFPSFPVSSVLMSGLPAAIGLFGVVLLSGLAVVLAALFAITLRRAARRKASRVRTSTLLSDAWAEAGRRADGSDRRSTGGTGGPGEP